MPSPVRNENLRLLLAPRSVAVVGASEKPGPGSQVLRNLVATRFEGPIYAVNPRYSEVQGLRCYSRMDEVPEPVDCVAVAVQSRLVSTVLMEAASAGARAAVVYGSGFAEIGTEGQQLQEELRRIAQEIGMVVCGPNCVGLINFHDNRVMMSVSMPEPLPKGRVAAVVQSGSVSIGLLNSGRQLGLSYLVSSGNEAVVDSADYMRFFLDDPHTDVIIAFIEGFRDGKKIREVANLAVQKKKPIVVLKVGRSAQGEHAVMAHTGALAGSDRVHDGFFKQSGIIRVQDFDELLETAEILLKAPLPRGERLGVITVSGGQVGMVADLAADLELDIPPLSAQAKQDLEEILPPFSNVGNPLDAWGTGDLQWAYPRCLERLAQDESLDLLAICQDAQAGLGDEQSAFYANIARVSVDVARNHNKPLVFFSNISGGFDGRMRHILQEGGVPLLQGTQESLRAIRHLVRWAAFLRKGEPKAPPSSTTPRQGRHDVERLLRQPVLSEHQGKLVLKAYDLPTTREELASSPKEAAEIADRIGYPVVLKVDSPDIAHKTEAGAVKLDIIDEAMLEQAYNELMTNARTHAPQAQINGILVQEMLTADGLELLAGTVHDPIFGSTVLFGLGGTLVEELSDVSCRLAPVSRWDAWQMLGEIRGRAMLDGVRGQAPVDKEAIVEFLLGLSQLAVESGERIRELDVNPLFAFRGGKGVVAADALLVTRLNPDSEGANGEV